MALTGVCDRDTVSPRLSHGRTSPTCFTRVWKLGQQVLARDTGHARGEKASSSSGRFPGRPDPRCLLQLLLLVQDVPLRTRARRTCEAPRVGRGVSPSPWQCSLPWGLCPGRQEGPAFSVPRTSTCRGGPGERRSWMRLGLVQPLFSGLEPFEPVSSTARASASSSVK